jgi:hypothetical protein
MLKNKKCVRAQSSKNRVPKTPIGCQIKQMKRRALILTCVLPIIPLWLVLIYLADQKYEIVSGEKYWDSRFDHNVEYVRSGGYVWFPPVGTPFHGFWPERSRESDIDAAFFPAWNNYVSDSILKESLESTSVVEKLHSMTGVNFGTNQAAWVKWKSENKLTKEDAFSLMPKPARDIELEDYFRFHIKNRYWFATLEAIFFCFLWTTVVVLGRWRFLNHSGLIKWIFISWFVAIIAFLPLLFGYGSGAFTTWQGPNALVYSGGHLWHGYISYGNSIGYRTFVEIFGSPPMWILQHSPQIDWLDGELGVLYSFTIFYAIAGFALASVAKLIRKKNAK